MTANDEDILDRLQLYQHPESKKKQGKGNAMKKLLLTVCMSLLSGAFSGTSAHAENLAVGRVIDVHGATKEQIIQKVRSWSERYAQFYNADTKTGVIVANGEIAYPSPPISRIQYRILFKMRNTIERDKDTVAFEEVMLKAPRSYLVDSGGPDPQFYGGEVEPVKSKSDIAAVKMILNYVADNLTDYLHNKAAPSCPLERCRECGLLSSPEGMKEHMKSHTGHEKAPKQ